MNNNQQVYSKISLSLNTDHKDILQKYDFSVGVPFSENIDDVTFQKMIELVRVGILYIEASKVRLTQIGTQLSYSWT